jgi:hypothetical protein
VGLFSPKNSDYDDCQEVVQYFRDHQFLDSPSTDSVLMVTGSLNLSEPSLGVGIGRVKYRNFKSKYK